MDLLAIVGNGGAPDAIRMAAEGADPTGLQINFFWVIVSSINFLIFLAILYTFALKPVSRMLNERRDRIEAGLRDAEQARRDREQAESERVAALAEARREANDILSRAQRVAQETREADIAATREELERMRQRAADEIQAEKQRAMADLRSEVASLALEAAGKVVGESMDDARQRRLVEEFLRETTVPGSAGSQS